MDLNLDLTPGPGSQKIHSLNQLFKQTSNLKKFHEIFSPAASCLKIRFVSLHSLVYDWKKKILSKAAMAAWTIACPSACRRNIWDQPIKSGLTLLFHSKLEKLCELRQYSPVKNIVLLTNFCQVCLISRNFLKITLGTWNDGSKMKPIYDLPCGGISRLLKWMTSSRTFLKCLKWKEIIHISYSWTFFECFEM